MLVVEPHSHVAFIETHSPYQELFCFADQTTLKSGDSLASFHHTSSFPFAASIACCVPTATSVSMCCHHWQRLVVRVATLAPKICAGVPNGPTLVVSVFAGDFASASTCGSGATDTFRPHPHCEFLSSRSFKLDACSCLTGEQTSSVHRVNCTRGAQR